ncbi:MAG: hypothetical protein RL380_1274 [Verrucomicrobiota bacterium]
MGLLLGLFTLVLYLPVARHGFVVYDDGDYLLENPVVQNGLTWAGVRWAFVGWHAHNWHPLTWLSHMLDCELFGLDAAAHHLMSAALHAVNASLLCLLLLRLTRKLWPSVVVAALFAWHPLRVESVAWAAERKDVLSGLFALLTLWFYARHLETVESRKLKAENPSSTAAYWFALLFFALGLLSKPMLVTLPCVLWLLDWWPGGRFADARQRREAVREKWPFLLLAAVVCVVTCLAQRAAAMVTLEQQPWSLRLGNAALAYAQYLSKTFFPASLAVIYPLPKTLAAASVGAAGLLLGAVTWLAWRGRRSHPWGLVGWLWFLGMLVPVIGLVQVGRQAFADRYTYLPHIGGFIALVFGVHAWAATRPVKPVVLGAVAAVGLAACVTVTERQLRHWQDSETLFTHALAVTANNPVAHINLGVALGQQGRRAAALAEYRAAVRLDPTIAQAWNNLAILLDETERNDEAVAAYETALRLAPRAPLTLCNFATLLAKLGQFDAALEKYATAARLVPGDSLPHYLMGKMELRRGRYAEAVVDLHAALARAPDELRSLAWLARVRAAAPDDAVRHGAEAVALAARANDLTGHRDAFLLDTLAMAYAEQGRFAEAQTTVQSALEFARDADEPARVVMQARRELYRNRQPYREVFTNAARSR